MLRYDDEEEDKMDKRRQREIIWDKTSQDCHILDLKSLKNYTDVTSKDATSENWENRRCQVISTPTPCKSW